jgi:metallo-beta-lactamase class B
MVMDADVPVVESGGKSDFHYSDDPTTLYPPTKVDHILRDGEEVRLGDAVLTAHLTPGHTKGCTTWTMKVKDGETIRDVVIVGSPNVNPGYKLVSNPTYPRIAEDFARTFQVLKSLPCDYFLGAHGSYFDLETKYAQMKAGVSTAFIDPAGYKNFVTEKERAFRRELTKQKGTGAVNNESGRKEGSISLGWSEALLTASWYCNPKTIEAREVGQNVRALFLSPGV